MERCTYICVVPPQMAEMSFAFARTVDFVQLVLEACLLRVAHAGHCSLNRQIQSLSGWSPLVTAEKSL